MASSDQITPIVGHFGYRWTRVDWETTHDGDGSGIEIVFPDVAHRRGDALDSVSGVMARAHTSWFSVRDRRWIIDLGALATEFSLTGTSWAWMVGEVDVEPEHDVHRAGAIDDRVLGYVTLTIRRDAVQETRLKTVRDAVDAEAALDRRPSALSIEDLVTGPWFGVGTAGMTSPIHVAQHFGTSLDEVRERLEHLVARGLLRRTGTEHEGERLYVPEPSIWTEREKVFRSRGQRSRVIAESTAYDLADVVHAIAVGCANADRDVAGPFYAGDGSLPLDAVLAMLFDRSPDEIMDAVGRLEVAAFVEPARQGSGTDGTRAFIRVTGRGELEYETVVSRRLDLPAGANVYRVAPMSEFTIFFIWQSDVTRCRNHLANALKDVIGEANAKWSPIRPVVLENATMIGDGAVPIDQSIFARIRGARIVVADFTPVGKFCDVRCPNPNVLVEVGYALACKEPEQVWLVEWEGSSDEAAPTTAGEPLPFDVDKVHRIRYQRPSTLRDRLRAELRHALQRSAWVRSDSGA